MTARQSDTGPPLFRDPFFNKQNKDTPTDKNNRPCMHMLCPRCRGSGLAPDGTSCIHSMACPCNRCTPWA